jgi:hypothetical protein
MTTEMSNIIIHLGAPSRPRQDIASEVKETGLMLLRCTSECRHMVHCPNDYPTKLLHSQRFPRCFRVVHQQKIEIHNEQNHSIPSYPKVENKSPLPKSIICFSSSYALLDEVAQGLRAKTWDPGQCDFREKSPRYTKEPHLSIPSSASKKSKF